MEQQSTQRRRTASVWRCRDLPFSNREPQFSVSGFQHEQICTSNHCTHLISHCACPVIHCRISKQNLRPRHTKLSLIIRQPMGKLYQTPLLPAEKDQVTRNRSIGRPNFFPHAARNHAFDPQKGSCKRLSRHQPHQSRLHFSPPIRFLSPAPTIIQPSHCSVLSTQWFLPFERRREHELHTNTHFRDKRMESVPYSPISVSDLLSISVSVSVSAELERLERHEFCPDFAPVPQRFMVRSGDTGSWFSVATGPLE